MAIDVILPALGMSQDTGRIVQWLKAEGEQVLKGEPLVEIETDKATVEIEAPADGTLARISASAGDDIPVGHAIALILAADEVGADGPHVDERRVAEGSSETNANKSNGVSSQAPSVTRVNEAIARPVIASSVASRIAAEHNLDLRLIKTSGRRIQKADVLTYLQSQEASTSSTALTTRLVPASPKARRLADEAGKDLAVVRGSGPGGVVLAVDVLAAIEQTPVPVAEISQYMPVAESLPTITNGASDLNLGHIWRIMAERTTQSWTSVPHFYLVREVNGSRLISWREESRKRSSVKITYTDLLVKIVATALHAHPRINATWSENKITLNPEVHMGLAVAVEDGLVVPVIHYADTLSIAEIARQRMELVAKAQAGKLRPQDIGGGTFTISNLGMYNIDAFNAIINQPQVAILAVGRIAERVVPVHGQPAVQPMLVLTLTCDHRAVDGARGAQFLDSIASLIEEPLGLLV
ncbi:MAG: dihydrolipoamide acetyltransferase family protein [Ktedonobacteraceae bacterium]